MYLDGGEHMYLGLGYVSRLFRIRVFTAVVPRRRRTCILAIYLGDLEYLLPCRVDGESIEDLRECAVRALSRLFISAIYLGESIEDLRECAVRALTLRPLPIQLVARAAREEFVDLRKHAGWAIAAPRRLLLVHAPVSVAVTHGASHHEVL